MDIFGIIFMFISIICFIVSLVLYVLLSKIQEENLDLIIANENLTGNNLFLNIENKNLKNKVTFLEKELDYISEENKVKTKKETKPKGKTRVTPNKRNKEEI